MAPIYTLVEKSGNKMQVPTTGLDETNHISKTSKQS